MTIPSTYDYAEAGLSIFPLWSITPGNQCSCNIYMPSASGEKCAAIGKHPRFTNWQHTQPPSNEYLDIIDALADTGFGVLTRGILVIDVDSRNNGLDSLKKLDEKLGFEVAKRSKFVVDTGSGSGSFHAYFRLSDETLALSAHLDDYPGIDFKSGSGGFVVGDGSLHKSGSRYTTRHGSPQDMDDAPDELLKLLERKTHTRSTFNGRTVDVSTDDLIGVLAFITNDDVEYDTWIKVGFAIHHCTAGTGFDLWDEWSRKSKKYDPEQMSFKWHSFGRSATTVTFGTLVFLAQQNGYTSPITFEAESETIWVQDDDLALPFDVKKYDLQRPPGLVGELVAWANANHHDEPLQRLNTVAMLAAVGAIVGLKTTSGLLGVSTNLSAICIAGTATGKETVMQNYAEVLRAGGMGPTIAGQIKSKQEILRNLIEHQAANYSIDEIGEVLGGIMNAKAHGGAAYLEGVIGEIMTLSGKASTSFQPGGDIKRDLIKIMQEEHKKCRLKVDQNEDPNGRYKSRFDALGSLMETLETSGLIRPFLSIVGYSVPRSIEALMTEENATSGFLGRFLMPQEENTNPAPIIGHKGRKPLPDKLKQALKYVSSTGDASMTGGAIRIEYYGDRKVIPATPDAEELFDRLRLWQHRMSEWHKHNTSMEGLTRRQIEPMLKIATILAATDGVMTVQHLEWAAAFVHNDIERKVRAVKAAIAKDSKDGDEVSNAIEGKILNLCESEEGETLTYLEKRLERRKDLKGTGIVAKLVRQLVVKKRLREHAVSVQKHGTIVRYITT